MADWRNSMDNFFEKSDETKKNKDITDFTRFIRDTALPALKELREQMEKHGRELTIKETVSSLTARISSQGKEELVYGVYGRTFPNGVLPYAEVKYRERNGLKITKVESMIDPEPSAVIALHGWPGLPTGVIASRVGDIFASADIFNITVKGYGAHGSTPHKSIDPIVTACRIVDALQGIVAREIAAEDTLVVSVCKFNAGRNNNVIPDTAVIGGTVRYYDLELGKKVRQRIEEIANGICVAMGATCELIGK